MGKLAVPGEKETQKKRTVCGKGTRLLTKIHGERVGDKKSLRKSKVALRGLLPDDVGQKGRRNKNKCSEEKAHLDRINQGGKGKPAEDKTGNRGNY